MEVVVNATISFVYEIDADNGITEQMAREHAIEMAQEELNEYLNGTRMPLDETDFAWSVEE